MSHACFWCQQRKQGSPCRVDGRVDPDLVARHFVGSIDATGKISGDEEERWSRWCIREAVVSDPDLAWQVILACVPLLQTRQQAAVFAAGYLEDLIRVHGTVFLDRIETEWQRSLRFRFVLSGVWVHRMKPDDPVRLGIERLKANRPHIDHGDLLPPA